jgi:molybdopterin converting factor small subunit
MQITLKLFASLASHLPPSKKNGIEADIVVPNGSTIGDMIELYKIPSKSAHLVMVNGVYVNPDQRFSYVLKENDALAICPPVAGG